MNAQLKAALASYARSVLSAAVALYLAGVTDPVQLLSALAAGLLPVAIRAINPKDKAFGKVAKVAEEVVVANLSKGEAVISKEYIDANKEAIEKLVKAYNDTAKPVAKKAPAKKPAAKK
jgi:uncharacterized protein YjgD (DUF1641 family)